MEVEMNNLMTKARAVDREGRVLVPEPKDSTAEGHFVVRCMHITLYVWFEVFMLGEMIDRAV